MGTGTSFLPNTMNRTMQFTNQILAFAMLSLTSVDASATKVNVINRLHDHDMFGAVKEFSVKRATTILALKTMIKEWLDPLQEDQLLIHAKQQQLVGDAKTLEQYGIHPMAGVAEVELYPNSHS